MILLFVDFWVLYGCWDVVHYEWPLWGWGAGVLLSSGEDDASRGVWTDVNNGSSNCWCHNVSAAHTSLCLSWQGLKPTVPSQAPPMIFAVPTKVVSETGSVAHYMGINKVPELQKIFQVLHLFIFYDFFFFNPVILIFHVRKYFSP